MLPLVMPVHSKRNVPKVSRGGNCTAPSMRATLNEYRATTRPQLIRRPCANGKCGWSRCLQRRKTGMGCAASACACTGRVNCEALRIAAGQNLKRLLKKRGWGRRPFPTEAMSASFWGLLRDVLVVFLEEWSFLMPIGSAYSMVRTHCVSLC